MSKYFDIHDILAQETVCKLHFQFNMQLLDATPLQFAVTLHKCEAATRLHCRLCCCQLAYLSAYNARNWQRLSGVTLSN